MKKALRETVEGDNSDMRAEYDCAGGARGKHYRSMQAGYTVTVREADGTTVIKDVKPKEGLVLIEPDVQAYFPDSTAVNKALRCLIPLLPRKRTAKSKHS